MYLQAFYTKYKQAILKGVMPSVHHIITWFRSPDCLKEED